VLGSRGITIFVCVPQFFYLIHQRVMAEVARKGAAARGLLRAIVAINVWLRDHTGLNPARRIFGRVHRSVGPRMRLFITGGSKFDPAIRRDLYGLGFTILNAYGLTETSGGATITRPDDRFTESVGQPLPGVDLRIEMPDRSAPAAQDADEDGKDDGEVLIRGPIVMREYFSRPDATRDALRMAGFARATWAASMNRAASTSPAARRRSSFSVPARTCIPRNSKATTGKAHISKSSVFSA
jgi:long-chain acyl-CoA synthetase